MRVALFLNLIDPKWLSFSMERYGLELKRNLERLSDAELELISFQPEVPKLLTFLPAKYRFLVSRYYYYPFYAQRHEGNVNHIVDQSFAQVAKWLDKDKTVVTCHDLIPLKILPNGQEGEKDQFARQTFRKSVAQIREVRMVLADSKATKKDLVEMLGVAEDKIKVVYLGRNEVFKPRGKDKEIVARLNLPEKPLLLHVGHNLDYKNIEGLFKSLQILKEGKSRFHLVKVGPEFSLNQRQLIRELDLQEEITNVGNLSEKDLIALYNSVDILVYPSLVEGFGLPVVEAMSCGLPVVVSKGTSLEEISGSDAQLVDALDPESIAAGVRTILEMDPKDLVKRREDSVRQAFKFNWEKTAQETYQVYQEIYEH